MGPSEHWLLVSSVLFSLSLAALGADSNLPSLESLSAVIRDSAFDELARHRTGVVSEVPLPPNLAGVRASVVRVRSGNFWSYGAHVGSIRIPPMATAVPFVRRLAVVRQDLGNLSWSYFDIPGFSLAAPVVGFLAYDASNNATADGVRELALTVYGQMISITFPEVRLPAGLNGTVKCVRLGPGGSVQLFRTSSRNACSSKRTGYFALVVPTVAAGLLAPLQAGPAPLSSGQAPLLSPLSPEKAMAKATAERETRRRVWGIASVGAVVGLVLVGFAGVGIFTSARRNRRAAMAMKAEEDEELSTVWAGRSKMPSAAMSRTGPTIEDDTVP